MAVGNEVRQVVKCGGCKQELDEAPGLPADSRQPCPHCNSKSRFFEVEIGAELKIHSTLGAKARHPGPGKPFLELLAGASLHKKTGVWNTIERVIDRAKDWYKEVVTDRKTGAVLHRCEEPLSQHKGHGSARKK